jgi:hypothetical protein
MTRAKSVLAHLALICLGVGLALLIGESALRLAGLAKPGFYAYDRYRGWGLRAGAQGWQEREGHAWVSINRDGFRGPRYSRTKPAETIRVAVLGDSFVEGQQVPEEQTFCAVIRRALARCPALAGRHVEVLNLGVNGYGTAQELMTLRHQAWQFSPDIVVLAVFTGNDIKNNSIALEGERCRPFYLYRGGELVLGGPFIDSRLMRMRCMARFESRLRFDSGNSQLLSLANRAWLAFKQRRHKAGQTRPVGSEPGLNDAIYQAPTAPVWQEAWRVTDAEIGLIAKESADHGAGFLAVTLTNGIQVYPDPAVRRNYMEHFGLSDLFYPERRIAALGRRDHFAVLTLAQPLQAYADAHHLFLHGFSNTQMGTGHWNALGNRLGGELVAQRLCQMIVAGKIPSVAPAPLPAQFRLGPTGASPAVPAPAP